MEERDLKKLEDKLWAAADKMRGAVEQVIRQAELKYQEI